MYVYSAFDDIHGYLIFDISAQNGPCSEVHRRQKYKKGASSAIHISSKYCATYVVSDLEK